METTPSCKKFRLWADEYIEGELTAAEMRELEAHIAECEECRKVYVHSTDSSYYSTTSNIGSSCICRNCNVIRS